MVCDVEYMLVDKLINRYIIWGRFHARFWKLLCILWLGQMHASDGMWIVKVVKIMRNRCEKIIILYVNNDDKY